MNEKPDGIFFGNNGPWLYFLNVTHCNLEQRTLNISVKRPAADEIYYFFRQL